MPGLAASALCAWLAGCAGTPLPELPADDVPEAWRGTEAGDAWPAADWWHGFASDELAVVLDRVKAGNLELANAERNLRAAELALTDAGFDRYPSPSLDAGASGSYAGSRPRDGDFRDGGSDAVDLTLGVDYADLLDRRPRFAAATARYGSSLARGAAPLRDCLARLIGPVVAAPGVGIHDHVGTRCSVEGAVEYIRRDAFGAARSGLAVRRMRHHRKVAWACCDRPHGVQADEARA